MLNKILLLIAFVVSVPCFSQSDSAYLKRLFIQSGDTLPYRILFPDGYDTKQSYPVLFFLHGRGECGNDNQRQLTHGAKMFLTDSFRKKHPAIIIFPQCPVSSYWSNVRRSEDEKGKRVFNFVVDDEPSKAMQLLLGLVDYILQNHPVQKQQAYVMGLSMGGMGTFEIVRRKPGLFAAAIPICGAANPATAKFLKPAHWWIFHGEKDNVVSPEYSIAMQKAMVEEGVNTKITLYPDANHNSWDSAFAEPELMRWLFSIKNNKAK